MSQAQVSSAAIIVVGQYRQAGENLIRAYRDGSDRLVKGLHAQSSQAVSAGADKAVDLTIRGVHAGVAFTGRVIARLAQGAADGIERVNALTQRLGAGVSEAGHRIALVQEQATNASVQFADQVVQLSERVSARMVDDAAPSAPAVKKSAGAKRPARRTRRAA